LITCITEENQLDFKFGLNFARVTTLIGASTPASRPVTRAVTYSRMTVSMWGLAVESLGDGGRVDVHLDRRVAPCEAVRLEFRGDFDDEHETLGIR
jgi:hypothetical protein